MEALRQHGGPDPQGFQDASIVITHHSCMVNSKYM